MCYWLFFSNRSQTGTLLEMDSSMQDLSSCSQSLSRNKKQIIMMTSMLKPLSTWHLSTASTLLQSPTCHKTRFETEVSIIIKHYTALCPDCDLIANNHELLTLMLDYTIADPQDGLWKKGYTRLYATDGKDGPWYDVIPICRIMGQIPLVPDFVDGIPHIPNWASRNKNFCFPDGKHTTKTKKGSWIGYVNRVGMKFGR